MSDRDGYAPGEFTWIDLATSDTEAAARLYGELLGWEAVPAEPVEESGGYGFFVRDGRQLAGFGPVQGEGQPSHWTSYVKVESADETAEKAGAAGGQVLFGPIDLPADSGRMAIIADPQGAVLGVMEQRRHQGAQLVNEVGTWTWNQLATPDLDGAAEFYGQVFGWRLEPSESAPQQFRYSMWHVDGQRWPEGLGGAMLAGAQMPDGTPPHWMVYLGVEDADAAAEAVRRHGGQVLLEPVDIPVGRLAVMLDPQGAAFSVIQPDFPEPR